MAEQSAPASGARYRSLITGCSSLSMDAHLLWLSVDNPALPHYRYMCDFERLLQCLTGDLHRARLIRRWAHLLLRSWACRYPLLSSGFGPLSKRQYLIQWATRSRFACARLVAWSCWSKCVRSSALPVMKYGFASDLVNDRRMGDH
jgi:hypothetical protein